MFYHPESLLPRSAELNVTLDMWGGAFPVVETSTRLEGLEIIWEKLFGHKGYFPDNHIRGLVRTPEEQENVIKNLEKRSTDNVLDFESLDNKVRVNRSQGSLLFVPRGTSMRGPWERGWVRVTSFSVAVVMYYLATKIRLSCARKRNTKQGMVLTIAFINRVIVVSVHRHQRFYLEQLCNTFDGNGQRVSFQLNVYTVVFKRPLSSLDKSK